MSGRSTNGGTTGELLARAHAGDRAALDELCARYIPRLRHWARCRVPERGARNLDTDDFVQETILRFVRGVDRVQTTSTVGFRAFLRTTLENRIHDEYRLAGRAPRPITLDPDLEDPGPSALQDLVRRADLERYESALKHLGDDERELVIAKLEMQMSHAEIAEEFGKPSTDAARMAVTRAVRRLLERMADLDDAAP